MKLFVNLWVKFVGVLWAVISVVMLVFILQGETGVTEVIELGTPLGYLYAVGSALLAGFGAALGVGFAPIIGQLIPFIIWINTKETNNDLDILNSSSAAYCV